MKMKYLVIAMIVMSALSLKAEASLDQNTVLVKSILIFETTYQLKCQPITGTEIICRGTNSAEVIASITGNASDMTLRLSFGTSKYGYGSFTLGAITESVAGVKFGNELTLALAESIHPNFSLTCTDFAQKYSDVNTPWSKRRFGSVCSADDHHQLRLDSVGCLEDDDLGCTTGNIRIRTR